MASPRRKLSFADVVKVTQALEAHKQDVGARPFRSIPGLLEHLRKKTGLIITDKQLRACLEAIDADMGAFVSHAMGGSGQRSNPLVLAWERIKSLEAQVDRITTILEELVQQLEQKQAIRQSLDNRLPILRGEVDGDSYRLATSGDTVGRREQ